MPGTQATVLTIEEVREILKVAFVWKLRNKWLREYMGPTPQKVVTPRKVVARRVVQQIPPRKVVARRVIPGAAKVTKVRAVRVHNSPIQESAALGCRASQELSEAFDSRN